MDTFDLFRKLARSVTEFEITEQHLALLRGTFVSWDDCEFGAPSIDPKRPYGNSDVVRDIAEIVVDDFNDREEADQIAYVDTHAEELVRLHLETGIALQICLTLGAFETGTYRRPDTYSPGWARVDDGTTRAPADIAQAVAHQIEYFYSKFGFTAPELMPERLEEFRRGLLHAIGAPVEERP